VDGKSFSSPVRVNDRQGDAVVRNENPPKVAVAPNGDVYVCWANERARWKGDVRFARSSDGGKTFAPAVTLNSDGGGEPAGHAFQSLAVDHRGRIYVVWIDERNKQTAERGAEIWLATSEDHGRSFSRDRKILSDVCECCRTSLAADSAGRLFVSYRTVPAAGPMYRDIVVAKSLDGGRTFTTRVVSQDGWEINGCPVAGPSLNVESTGRITVIWFVGGGDRPGLYYATSTNQGASFSPRRLLDPHQKMRKHAAVVSASGGTLFVAWDDVADKTVAAWGVLDPQAGLRKLGEKEGSSYPIVAASGRSALIAAIEHAGRTLFLQREAVP
jgi:hypothetical protein